MKNQPKLAKSTFPPLLSLTYVLQQSADELLLREVRVSLSHARIMSALSSTPVSQRSVAMALNQTEANVSRQLQIMKKQGLVSITKNKQDHRQRDVKLSAKGAKKNQQSQKLLKKEETRLVKLVNSDAKRALGNL